MNDYLHIEATPSDENCLPAGYDTKLQKLEANTFVDQLCRMFPDKADLVQFQVCKNPHDFGMYCDIKVWFDPDNDAETDAAYFFESDAPEKWDDTAKEKLRNGGYPEDVLSGGR